jgi:TrpR-related protein YerC/YecD
MIMNWNTKENKGLVQAVIALDTSDEAERFLRDLLTEGEIEEFAKRLKAARMLSTGSTYAVVEKATGFSSTTVARVSKWLNNGKGGYKTILGKIHHDTPIQTRRGLA